MSAAELWNCDINEYHADGINSVSHSELDTFIEDPALYHGRYITGIYPREATKALEFGQVFHAVLLGQPLDDFFTLIPEDALNADGHRKGAAWKEFAAEHSGKVLLKDSEFQPIDEMYRKLLSHPAARQILESEGPAEQSIRWTDPETGLALRCRLDKLSDLCIADLKSAVSVEPRAFAAAAARYGYARQAAMYQDGVRALAGDEMAFVFIACKKTPAYTVETFTLSERFIELGRQQNRDALRRLAECRATGVWEHATHGQVCEIEPPAWLAYESEWQFAESGI